MVLTTMLRRRTSSSSSITSEAADVLNPALVDPFRWVQLLPASGVTVPPDTDADWWREAMSNTAHFQHDLATPRDMQQKLSRVSRKLPPPYALRAQIWYRISGGESYAAAYPGEYARHKDDRISDADPNFGGQFDPSRFAFNADGRVAYSHILNALRIEHSDALYCPLLPFMAAVCLHFLTEEQTYNVCCALVVPPFQLITSRLDSWTMLYAFDALARSLSPRAYELLLTQHKTKMFPLDQKHPLRGIIYEWFADDMPFWCAVRLLDNFFAEGVKTFYRFGIAVLNRWYKMNANEGKQSAISDVIAKTSNPESIIAEAFNIKFPRSQVAAYVADGLASAEKALVQSGTHLAVGETVESVRRSRIHVRLSVPSIVLSSDTWLKLAQEIPTHCRSFHFARIFTTTSDGYNLSTLLRYSGDNVPTVLVVKTDENKVFGAYLTGAWSERRLHRTRKYFGTGESFVFTTVPTYTAYPWVGITAMTDIQADWFMTCDEAHVYIGGGGEGHAIMLDHDLQSGSSYPSLTFANAALTGTPGIFNIQTVEVWKVSTL